MARIFAESFSEIVQKSILILLFGLLKYFELERRYSILFGLTGNLFKAIQENISLIHNSSIEKPKVSVGE